MKPSHLVFGISVLLAGGCHQHPLRDYRPLDQAGMGSSAIEQLKPLNISDPEIHQVVNLKHASISDETCVALISTAHGHSHPFTSSESVADKSIVDTRAMLEQLTKRDGLVEPSGNLERFQIPINVGVEVDFPLFDELHHCDRRERLRDRGRSPNRVIQVNGSVTLRIDRPLLVRDDYGRGLDALVGDQGIEIVVGEFVQINGWVIFLGRDSACDSRAQQLSREYEGSDRSEVGLDCHSALRHR